jgi:hypothetical protein
MASAKQIAANRANAKRSTGPRTSVGKMKSSRNAFRHGLSSDLWLDPATSLKAEAMALALVGQDSNSLQLSSAAELAATQLELFRIRQVRAELMTTVDPASCDPTALKRLHALDRYERVALTKRRRASYKL